MKLITQNDLIQCKNILIVITSKQEQTFLKKSGKLHKLHRYKIHKSYKNNRISWWFFTAHAVTFLR